MVTVLASFNSPACAVNFQLSSCGCTGPVHVRVCVHENGKVCLNVYTYYTNLNHAKLLSSVQAGQALPTVYSQGHVITHHTHAHKVISSSMMHRACPPVLPPHCCSWPRQHRPLCWLGLAPCIAAEQGSSARSAPTAVSPHSR